MTWSDYVVTVAAPHSRGSARHWFRYLRKDIDKCGVMFSKQDVEALYRNEALTPFQRVSIKAAFEEGSPTRQHIIGLNRKATRSKNVIGMKFVSAREQDLIDIGDILKRDDNKQPFELRSKLASMGFDVDISSMLDAFERAHGMDWLDEFYAQNEEELRRYF